MLDHTRCGLLVVDAQKGFSELCKEELPVPGALQIVNPINTLLGLPWGRVDATQDWHPFDHTSFQTYGGPYPPHCVQGTPGADFLPGLFTHRFHAIWRKGLDPRREAYSVGQQHPEFPSIYGKLETAVLCGICTNICVFECAKELRREGMRIVIVEDASVGIDIPELNISQAETKEEGLSLGFYYVKVKDIEPGKRRE